MARQYLRPFIADVPEAWVRGRRGPAGPSWNDLRVLIALVQQRRPRHVLENGVHEGHTAALLLAHGDTIEHYVGIDRAPRDPGRWTPSEAGKQAEGDRRFQAVVPAGGTRGLLPIEIPGGPFDFIFIDSDHSYRGVAYDTPFAEHALDPAGGMIVWHDYGVPSQFQPGGPVFGVMRYLNERNQQLWRRSRVTTFVDPPLSSSIAFETIGPVGSR